MSVRRPETEPLRFYLFGTPRAERGGSALSIRRRKGVALLTYLAVTAQPHTREALATLFWPEQKPSTALANLRRDLARLRQDVGELFDADRQQIGLAAGVPLWVDVEQFHEQLALVRAHGHPSDHSCDACLAALTGAAALYTADFLSGFTLPDSPQWDEWHFFQAESLRQRFGRALQSLIAWHVRQGEYAAAIPFAQRWLALDPLEEVAHRTLMRLFAWNGQRAAALRQYDEVRRVLHAEMGVLPDEATEALIQQVRTRQLSPPDTASVPELTPTMPPQARYVRERQLAVGGQGEVVLAQDQITGRAVVLKRLRAGLGREQPEQIARFLREAEILRRLHHPNIVQFLDSYDDGGQQVIVMEYVPGGTLRDLLRRGGPLPVERVVPLGLELADALGRAHHLGIVHRDLKPGNILLAEDGTPRLTDFGVAHLEQAGTRLTQTGALVGSPAYMSPEAVRGEPLDGRSDVWSLGVLLWELLAGHRLYESAQIPHILMKILQEPVPDIRVERPSVPQSLATLLERMLVKERDQRVGSMRQVAATLEAIRAGETVEFLTPAPAPSPRVAKPGPRSSTLSPRPFAPADQQIRFTSSADGTRIAYAVVGEGPPLVKVANPLTHLQYDWESPVWRHWIEGLSQEHTLIRYDERGCGLSERNVTRFSIDAWVEDLEAVVDDLGLERFPIIGTSQGPSVAIAYAVRHPERVSHLIFCGGYARGRFRRGKIPDRTEGEMLLSLIRFGWGQDTPVFRRVFASLFVPEGTPEQIDWFTQLARVTTNPETAALMEQAFYELDVSHLAAQVTVPTLVMHPRGDAMIPFQEGKLIADLIPHAHFVPLDSQNHILLKDEPAWGQFLEAVRDFLRTESSMLWSASGGRAQPTETPPDLSQAD